MYTLHKNSWHYRFAAMFSSYPHHETNLCPYVRMVVKGMLIYTFFTTIVTGFAIMNLLGIADIVNGFWNHDKLSPFILVNMLTVGTIAAVFILAGLHWLREKYDAWQYRRYVEKRNNELAEDYTPPEPGLVRLWWNSVHEKVCPRIEIK